MLALVGIAAVAPLLAGGEAGNDALAVWQPLEVLRECEQFDRGNVRADMGTWGPKGWCILNAGRLPNRVEYDFVVRGGWYQVLVRYAAATPRPVRLILDGARVAQVCLRSTGSWNSSTAGWFREAVLWMPAGRHTIALGRDGPFPHLDAWALARLPVSLRLVPDRSGGFRLELAGALRGTAARLRSDATGKTATALPVMPGERVWIVLSRPPREAGPLMVANLNVTGRLARTRAWVSAAARATHHIKDALGRERAREIDRKLRRAMKDLARLEQAADEVHETAAERNGEALKQLRAMLERIGEVEDQARPAVYAALGLSGRAHEAMRKLGYFTLVGNQLVATTWTKDFDRRTGRPVGNPIHLPGVASISYYPPGGLTYFCVSPPAARVQLRRAGRPVTVTLDELVSDWRPHILHTEYFVEGGGRIVQDLCVAGDVAVARVDMQGLAPGVEVVVAGEAIRQPADEARSQDGCVSVTFGAGGRRLAQAVAVSPAPASKVAKGTYEVSAARASDGRLRLTIAVTIGPDEDQARRKVLAAVADPARAFESAGRRWERFFGALLPRFACSDDRLMAAYYFIAYVLWADRYEPSDDGPWKHPYVVPSKWTWRGIWPEDLSHCLTGLRWLNDPETAYSCLRVIRDHFFSPAAAQRAKVHAYGLLTMAAWEVYQRYGQVEFVREIYPTLRAMNDFISAKCDFDADGLPAMWDSFHLGWDSSRRYDCDGNLYDGRRFKRALEPVDCAVYFWRQSALLARLAAELGHEDDARRLQQRAAKTRRAINSKMWDEASGFFYDVFADGEERCSIKSCAGLFPLIGGELEEKRKRSLVGHLTNAEEFWSPYPVPCLAMNEPNFGSVWSGASCLRNNWLIYRGLMDCGQAQVAAQLVRRTLNLLHLTPPDRVNEGYYFDPRTGRPAADNLGNLFSTPLAGVLDMILTGVCGLRPSADAEWAIAPLPELQPRWWILDGVKVGQAILRAEGGEGVPPRLEWQSSPRK